MDFSALQPVINVLLPIAGVIAMTSWAYTNWRSGSSRSQSELVVTLTAQLKAQKEINDSQTLVNNNLQNQISDMKKELGKLEGQNEMYEKIIQNRDPNLEQTLNYLKTVAEQAVIFMTSNSVNPKKTVTVTKEVKKEV